MKLTRIILKSLCLFLGLMMQVSIGQAVERSLDETKPLLCSSQSITINHTVKKGILREYITPNLELFDLKALREQHTKEFAERAYECGDVPYSVGLLAIINLSSSDLKILHHKVQAKTRAIFPRGYRDDKYVETIPLLREDTEFINLHKCPDKNGEDLYFISPEILISYFPMSCNVIVFAEYDSHDEQCVIEGILKRYKSYVLEDKHLLDERIKREPLLFSYLENPESFSTSLRNKKLIFFYEDKVFGLG